MLKKIVVALLPLMLSVAPLSSYAAATPAPNMALLNSILSQERAWAGLQSKTVTADGITFAYSEGGPTNAPNVLLIHGFSGSRDNWNRVAHQLTKKYHVYALDLVGHGDTAGSDTYDFQLPNQMTSVRSFVTALNIGKGLHVAGHSMGGAIAALYTAMYFQEVQSLLLVDTAGVFKNNGNGLAKDPQNLPSLLVRKPGDLKKLISNYAMYDPPFIPNEVMEAQEKVQMDHVKWHEKLMNTLIEQAKLYSPETFQLALRSIEAPTLVIWGEKDAIIDVSVLDELKEHLKNESVITIPNVGHTPILEADYAVSQAYLPFLDKAQATPNKFAPPSK